MIRIVSIAFSVVLVGLVAFKFLGHPPADRETGRAAIGGDFLLLDQDGQPRTWQDFRGKPTLIYFGYTYCPDVCPTALQEMGAALAMLGSEAKNFQPVFITIDPERDTPEAMAQYVRSNGFPENMIGLTGSADQVAQAAKQWLVIYRRSDLDRGPDDYLMDHSSFIYLMAADGEFVTAFTHADSPKLIADCLRKHLAGQSCRR